MPKFTVSVTRSISTDVEVEADTPDAAAAMVNLTSFPLPPLEEWQGNKDWMYAVYDENDDLVHEEPRD